MQSSGSTRLALVILHEPAFLKCNAMQRARQCEPSIRQIKQAAQVIGKDDKRIAMYSRKDRRESTGSNWHMAEVFGGTIMMNWH